MWIEGKKSTLFKSLHLNNSVWSEQKTWQDVVDANNSHQNLYRGNHSGTKKM